MKFEIKSRFDGSALFSIETDSWRLAIEAAVKSRADLSGANLGGADLSRADLSGAYLSGANLGRANLSRANLSGAYLGGAYLSRANLSGAYLSGAYLSGADLGGADLSRANLSGAYLGGAYLSGAYGVTPKVLQILGSKHPLIVCQYGRVIIGCHNQTLEWWEENYSQTGVQDGYSETEIAEYAEHIASARKFMERYQLLKAPEPTTESA